MRKFTFVFNYRGGIFISQFMSFDENTAFRFWLDSLAKIIKEKKEIEVVKADFLNSEIPLPPLSELTNTWCATCLFKDYFGILNVIESIV